MIVGWERTVVIVRVAGTALYLIVSFPDKFLGPSYSFVLTFFLFHRFVTVSFLFNSCFNWYLYISSFPKSSIAVFTSNSTRCTYMQIFFLEPITMTCVSNHNNTFTSAQYSQCFQHDLLLLFCHVQFKYFANIIMR